MSLKQITSFELYKLKPSFEWLKESWFDKSFYNPKEGELLLRFRNKDQKVSLFFVLPHFLIIKEGFFSVNWNMSQVNMILRKRLKNSKLLSLKQIGFDRILELTFSSGYNLFIELFDKGALILTDTEGTIITAYPSNNAQRDLKPRRRYEKPKNSIVEPFSLSSKDIKDLTKGLNLGIVKVLASKLGFGRIYAEEICFRSQVNKNKTELNENESKSILKAIKELREEDPKGFVYTEHLNIEEKNKNNIKTGKGGNIEVSIVRLKHLEGKFGVQEFDTFFRALEYYYELTHEENKRMERLSKEDVIIKKQEENLKRILKEQEENKIIGTEIYNHYNEIKETLEMVKKIVKSKKQNPDKIKEIKENCHRIKDVNLKEGYFIIEL